MAKEDIIRGLEGAMSKGETLENAMYSFYNAGYKKEDVEAAATALSTHLSQQESLIPNVPLPKKIEVPRKPIEIRHPANLPKPVEIKQPIPLPKPVAKPVVKPAPIEIKKPTLQPIKEAQQKPTIPQKSKVAQNVSRYEVSGGINTRTIMIIIIAVLLANLLAALIVLIVFRQSLLEFFNNFFTNALNNAPK